MMPKHRRLTAPMNQSLFLILTLLLATARCTHGILPPLPPFLTPPPPPPPQASPTHSTTVFNKTTFTVIIVLLSFLFSLTLFFIYMRQCNSDGDARVATITLGGHNSAAAMPPLQRGLDSAVLAALPTMVYEEVRDLRIGRGALECAVCLDAFVNHDVLRLLPACSHVFHKSCIDFWLADHVTCPVCRHNLAAVSHGAPSSASPEIPLAVPGREPEVEIDCDEEEERRRREDAADLERMRAMRSRLSRPPVRCPRSNSTGHSLTPVGVRTEDSLERFTLRLPEHVRREVIAAGRLKRMRSLVVFQTTGEGSSILGGGPGAGRSLRGWSVRLGQSGRRWPAVLARSLSATVAAWGGAARKDQHTREEQGEASSSNSTWEGEGWPAGRVSPGTEDEEAYLAGRHQTSGESADRTRAASSR